jgi:hypothetical protein
MNPKDRLSTRELNRFILPVVRRFEMADPWGHFLVFSRSAALQNALAQVCAKARNRQKSCAGNLPQRDPQAITAG